jgi:hypothetical protein
MLCKQITKVSYPSSIPRKKEGSRHSPRTKQPHLAETPSPHTNADALVNKVYRLCPSTGISSTVGQKKGHFLNLKLPLPR